MRPCVFIVIASLLLCFNAAIAWSATYTVDHAGSGDFTTIQAAIDASGVVDGDLVIVLPGTYVENVVVDKHITIRSQDGPLVTTIDGDHRGAVVTFFTLLYQVATLEGFTITNGTGYYDTSGPVEHRWGGGVYCNEGGFPHILNNHIAGNTAERGGGIYCENTSSPTIEGNVITGNTAKKGGGIYAGWCNPVIIGNTIYQNKALEEGGGINYTLNGPTNPLHYPLISRNRIGQNEAAGEGGGIFISDVYEYTISSNYIYENRGSYGAGISTTGQGVSGGATIIINNLIVRNTATYSAGAMKCESHNNDLQLLSNTIADNEAEGAVVNKGIWLHFCTNTLVKNSIFWDNGGVGGGNISIGSVSSLTIDYCDLQYGAASIYTDPSSSLTYGANNIDSDPQFVGGRLGYYYLKGTFIFSPCVNAGDDLASNVCFLDDIGSTTCMSDLGTNPDDSPDVGTVDMGYHPVLRAAYVTDRTLDPYGTGDYATIQEAINASLAGATIYLEDGVYTGYGNRDLSFQGKDITVRSLSLDPEACYIDCQGGPGALHRGVVFDSAEGPDAILRGVGIRNGYIEGGYPDGFGGGIRIVAVNFEWNTKIPASPTITECALVDCQAEVYGGGIYVFGGVPNLSGCSFRGNTAEEGAGLTIYESDAIVEDCTFHANTATILGGGIACYFYCSPSIDGCTITDNTAPAIAGAGIHCYGSATPTIANTIIAFNNTGSAVKCDDVATATVFCSDVYGNDGGDWIDCLTGQDVLNDNLTADPFFCDLPGGDLTLRDDSPCAAANNPACGQVGAYGVGCASGPTTYMVCPDGSGDFTTIQAAIDAADPGDTVELCDSTYTGVGNRDLDYLGKAITVRSQSGSPDACIIDCQYLGRGFQFQSGEGADSILEGVKVLNGDTATDGGGILFQSSSPTITNCVFELCVAGDDGGGAAMGNGANPTLTDCSFINNQSLDNGGGVYVSTSAPTLTNCLVEGNQCDNDGGGIFCLSSTGPAFADCTIKENHALDEASGIGCWSSTATMTGSLLVDNVSDGQWGGAALATQGGTLTVDQCTISGNSGVLAGGLVADAGATLAVSNTIVAFGLVGPAAECGSGTITLDCCNLYGNAGGDWVGCITGQFGGDNISADPVFCNPIVDDYTLAADSPCATPACGQMGAFGVGCPPYYPDIAVYPSSYTFNLSEGETECRWLEISNHGQQTLTWSSSTTAPWLFVTGGGSLGGFEVLEYETCVNATGLDPGSYSDDIIITSNDPDEPTVTIPVNLTVDPVPLGDIYLSAFPDQPWPGIQDVVALTPFHWYVVVDVDFADIGRPEINPTDGIAGWEVSLNVPPEITVLSRTLIPPSSLNIGSLDNYIVGTGVCLTGNQMPYAVVDYYAMVVTTPSNMAITLGPASPSSFSPPEPGWFSCVGTSPRTFATTQGLVLNPTISVKSDGTGDYPTIQAAIDAPEAVHGCIVYLADGTYTGVGNRDLDYRGKAITVRSSSGNPEACIIDCENVARGVWFQQGEGSNSILRGITIRNGEAPDMGDGVLDGGAVRCGTLTIPASPTIEDCIFESSHANDDGGGLSVDPGSAPTIVDCVIDNNGADDQGGGVYCTNTSGPSFSGVVIENNHASNVGGGISLLATGSVTIASCTIRNNGATNYGGGVYTWGTSSTMTDCLVYGNVTPGVGGGFMATHSGSAVFDRCTFYGNSGTDGGGLVSAGSSSVAADNTIIASSPNGAAAYCTTGTITLTCCDLYGNAGGDWVGCVASQFGGGNISEDPLFCGPAQGLFGLDDDSPCQPANNSCGVQMGAFGVECHATAAPEEEIPTKVTLAQNHPNPFNPRTVIQFGLPRAGMVDLAIFDVRGRCVRHLIDHLEVPAGMHEIQWNGTDDAGRPLGSGVYIYRLETAAERISRKMTLLQ